MEENCIFETFQSGFHQHYSTETALLKSLIKSCLLDRKVCVHKQLYFFVCYGQVGGSSILEPILSSFYMLPLGNIILRQCYADDTELYVPVKPTDLSMLSSLQKCLVDVRNWITSLDV